MQVPVLARSLIVVTGKGGTGKTTLAGALGLILARAGRSAIVVDVDGSSGPLAEIFGVREPVEGGVSSLAENLDRVSIDQERALARWVQAIGGRVPGRIIASSSTFQYFAAAAPGARELVGMIEIAHLIDGERREGRRAKGGHDVVVLDAPATGHALGMLAAPETFARIARSGPVATQARSVRDMLEDEARSAYVAVAQCSEMSVTETLELGEQLESELGRSLDAVLVNNVLPRHFSAADMVRIEELERSAGGDELVVAACMAARSSYARASAQQSHLARLRRHGMRVVTVPYVFGHELDMEALETIAGALRGRMQARRGAGVAGG